MAAGEGYECGRVQKRLPGPNAAQEWPNGPWEAQEQGGVT